MSNPYQNLYGVLAEFEDTDSLIAAAKLLTDAGYRRVDAYTPFPVEGLAEATGFTKTRVPLLVLIGGIIGGGFGYWLQWWVSVRAYPLNIGGRPHHSWPSFIPVTFELTILVAALFAVFGMLALNGLPRPHHPLFGVDEFARATTDGYFLCVEAADPIFDVDAVTRLLQESAARKVWNVPQYD
jgi:hypothetical protein